MPFISGQPLVRQAGDSDWFVEEPIVYRGNSQTFVVEKDYRTDFASIPRIFTWLLPTYGRYTRPAILHDKLCDLARSGQITRADADGLFRRSMRELGVAFLRRWLMWAGVRAQSVRDAGVAQVFRPASSFLALLPLWVFAIVYLFLPTVVILAELLVFVLVEWVLFPLVWVFQRRADPDTPANRPHFTWKL